MRMVRVLLVALLVVLLLLAGLPVLTMGMSHSDSCPLCTGPEGPFALTICAAVLVAIAVLTPLIRRQRFDALAAAMRHRLLTTRLDRPPQLV